VDRHHEVGLFGTVIAHFLGDAVDCDLGVGNVNFHSHSLILKIYLRVIRNILAVMIHPSIGAHHPRLTRVRRTAIALHIFGSQTYEPIAWHFDPKGLDASYHILASNRRPIPLIEPS
jgi:hypothetical protein